MFPPVPLPLPPPPVGPVGPLVPVGPVGPDPVGPVGPTPNELTLIAITSTISPEDAATASTIEVPDVAV